MKSIKTLCLLLLLFPTLAHAEIVQVKNFIANPQEMSNWCWAASIQAVFLTKGLSASQTQIVTSAFGAPVNKTAPGFMGTLKILNGLAVSSDGSLWKISAKAINTYPNANWLHSELENNRPVMIWYKDEYSNHAIVINGGQYYTDQYGGVNWQLLSAFDPFTNQNITIDGANIPKYVYGAFEIKLKKLEQSEPSKTNPTPSNAPPPSTPYGYKKPDWAT